MKIVSESGTEFPVKVEQICNDCKHILGFGGHISNLWQLQTYIGGHISVDDIVLMVETSCNKIESIELISFESSKASMAAPHSRQSHQNFITWLSDFEALLTVRMGL